MSDAPKAVFLSYAREDADEARRIAEALRGFGIEVWFDQSELRGGDAWDAKIRGQIKACALFMPIVSGRTEERSEGYFRREWKLAVDRTHDMAGGRSFIVPVVIDDTKETDAAVPEEFMKFQWTRLAAGEATPEFVAQVKRLLEPKRPALTAAPKPPMSTLPPFKQAAREQKSEDRGRGSEGRKSSLPAWVWGVVVVVVLGGGAVFLWLWQPAAETPPIKRREAVATPVSEVRKLVEKAKALQEDYAQDDTLRDNLVLAEQLCKRATDLDPTDGEAWAIYARVTLGMLFNDTGAAARLEQGHSQALRAMQLAPDSVAARVAMADYFRKQRTTLPEAERLMRDVIAHAPNDKGALRMLGLVLRSERKDDEALVYYDRVIALPGSDAKALITRAQILFAKDRFAEAEASINDSLALRSTVAGRLLKLNFVMSRGELDQARALLEQVPASSLVEDRGIVFASTLWLWLKEPDKSLAVLSGTTRDYFTDFWVAGSKGLLVGQALQRAGRTEAALAEWRGALQVIDRRLAAQPNDVRLLGERAQLLALLGDRAEAERVLRLCDQLAPSDTSVTKAGYDTSTAAILAAVGQRDAAIQRIESVLARSTSPFFRSSLRYDPTWDPLRGDQRFDAILKGLAAKK